MRSRVRLGAKEEVLGLGRLGIEGEASESSGAWALRGEEAGAGGGDCVYAHCFSINHSERTERSIAAASLLHSVEHEVGQ